MATLPTRRHDDEKNEKGKTESSHKVGASAKDHSAQNDKAKEHKDQDHHDDAELKALAERFVQAKNNPAEIQRIADEVKGAVGSTPPAPGQEPAR
jgi:electron transfer flavoprotein alpha subunit